MFYNIGHRSFNQKRDGDYLKKRFSMTPMSAQNKLDCLSQTGFSCESNICE